MSGALQGLRVAVTAPAGPVAPETFEAGVAALTHAGCRVRVMPHARGEAKGYLSAGDAERAADLSAAWCDPGTDLILCARGGYGCTRILPLLDWEALRQRPDLPVCGFSDVTALHWAMDRLKIGTPVAGPMLKGFADAEESCAAALRAALREEPLDWSRLPVLRPGHASGRILAGNLTVGCALAGTPYFPSAQGRIVVLEEVGEAPYRIDRMLTQLEQSGFFAGCAGAVFGYMTDCGEFMGFLREWAARQEFPVRYGLAFGHELPLSAFSFRCEARF